MSKKSREEIIKALEEFSSNSSDFREKTARRIKLRRTTRKSYIERRVNELYPLSSKKDIKSVWQKEAWSVGYNEALENIISSLEDEDIMNEYAENYAVLYLYSNKLEATQENKDLYKTIFKDTIKNLLTIMKHDN